MRRLDRPRAHATAALAAVLLGACATVPPLAPPPAPPLSGWEPEPPAQPVVSTPGRGGAALALPGPAERMQLLALQEWRLWGQGRWHADSGAVERLAGTPRAQESDPAFGTRVLHYWLAFKPRDFAPEKMRYDDGSVLPWSAAFISWLVTSAGVPERQFEPHELHWHYIRDALEAPAGRPGFEPLDAAATPPRPGDIACAPRDAEADTPRNFAAWRQLPRAARNKRWAWHCDLVVEVSGIEAGAIGGNVAESVTWTRAPLAAGVLRATTERPWAVLLRLRGVAP